MAIAGPCGTATRHARYVSERDRTDRPIVVIKTFAQSVSSSPEQPLHISLLRCSSPVSTKRPFAIRAQASLGKLIADIVGDTEDASALLLCRRSGLLGKAFLEVQPTWNQGHNFGYHPTTLRLTTARRSVNTRLAYGIRAFIWLCARGAAGTGANGCRSFDKTLPRSARGERDG